MQFIDRCEAAWAENESLLCVGLDPEPKQFPKPLQGSPTLEAVEAFCLEIATATASYCCAFKPQIAHFAALGGEAALERICKSIRSAFPQHLLILDAKRGDIGSTAQHYAAEAFNRYAADAVTVNPYMGSDSLAPYLAHADKGIFVLCRTSNPGGDDLQMQRLSSGNRLFEHVATLASGQWNQHGQVGLVVGATYPDEIGIVRDLAPRLPLLVPGIGAQGGDLVATIAKGATAKGGLFLNSSRAILYASSDHDWREAAKQAARQTHQAIQDARAQTNH
jgi:orotidine-5'-phosphate decarboxylase